MPFLHSFDAKLQCQTPGNMLPSPPTSAHLSLLPKQWFPGGIYDTKHLARMLPEIFEQRGSGTSLGDVFRAFTQGNPDLSHMRFVYGQEVFNQEGMIIFDKLNHNHRRATTERFVVSSYHSDALPKAPAQSGDDIEIRCNCNSNEGMAKSTTK